MTNTKLPFIERVPEVLKIIKEAKEPIERKEIYNKLKEKTGIKISKTTFEKCLSYLVSTCEITKTKERAPGNPVKYSANNDDFICKTKERIEVSSYLLKYFSKDSSPYGTEANLWIYLADEISDIVMSLISALFYYSQIEKPNEAFESYRHTIEAELVPHMLELHELVRSPIKMTRSTAYILFKLFHENIADSTKKPVHPFMDLTPEEREKISRLVNEKLNKSGTVFREKIPDSFDLNHIKDSNFIKEYIKYVEMQSEAFFEVRKYEDNAIPEYPKNTIEHFLRSGSIKTIRFQNIRKNLMKKDNIQSTENQLNDF